MLCQVYRWYTGGIQQVIQVGVIQGYTGKPGIPTILNHGVYRGYTAQRVYRGYTARILEARDNRFWGVYRVYRHPSAANRGGQTTGA